MGQFTGAQFGCIDHTPTPKGEIATTGDEVGEGYPGPSWNAFGYMLYDGPVRVFHDRFVNFNYNENWTPDMPCSEGAFYRELDTADCQFLKDREKTFSSPTGQPAPSPYQGDAALGWFQSNQSAYPTATASRELIWDNTNLRHQVYTEKVSVNTTFNDGDKNTVIIDEDGTLSGLGVERAAGAGTHKVHAISLNNLPFHSTSNSVDECLSRGAQNARYEGRDSALMSPATVGTLEFETPYPYLTDPAHPEFPGMPQAHFQYMTFSRDDMVLAGEGNFSAMTLKSRDGRGIWEPKVSNGYGYTVSVAPIPKKDAAHCSNNLNPQKAGIGQWIDVGVADVVDPNITPAHPFYVQLGICYTNEDGSHPADNFTIKRGYRTYVGGETWEPIPNCRSTGPIGSNARELIPSTRTTSHGRVTDSRRAALLATASIQCISSSRLAVSPISPTRTVRRSLTATTTTRPQACYISMSPRTNPMRLGLPR